ncbi:hypothetical protein D3C71_937290 [compost metagenome]
MLNGSAAGSAKTSFGISTLSMSFDVSMLPSSNLSPTVSHHSVKRGIEPCSRDQTRPLNEQPMVI